MDNCSKPAGLLLLLDLGCQNITDIIVLVGEARDAFKTNTFECILEVKGPK